MDFLKSAVASAFDSGPSFPYSFGDRVDVDRTLWELYNGTKKLPLAQNAVKKLRTLRHPGVVRVLDTVETDSYIYIATERLTPLRWHLKRRNLGAETLKWGLHTVANVLKFINDDAKSVHANVRAASVYLSESGEWKLGGFEVLSPANDTSALVYTHANALPDSHRYNPPECARSGWDVISKSPSGAVDAFQYGVLIYEVFNHGEYHGPDQVGQTQHIPPSMHMPYKRLVNNNPKARISIAHFLEQGRRSQSFFDLPLIKLTESIESLGLKTPEEREEFLTELNTGMDDFPEDYVKMKILPELLKSVEFGGGGPTAVMVTMKVAARLSEEDFNAKVTPTLIRLFGNPDRALRVSLLDHLPLVMDLLPQKTVNDKIFPQIVAGFTDVAPVVREQTLKSVLTFVPKLSDRTINGELLKLLAKTANDEQPGIRTNTTICLGKIAKHLSSSTRAKVLMAAFTRSLRDPFVHGRNASLMALAVTGDYFSHDDIAARILPALCPLLVDKEKIVRDQASKTVDVYLQKVRKAAESMPESVLPPSSQTVAARGVAGGRATPQPRMSSPDAVGETGAAAAAWAGWAISSFTNKLSAAVGDMQANSPQSLTPNPLTAAPLRVASTPPIVPSATTTTTTTTTQTASKLTASKPATSSFATRPSLTAPASRTSLSEDTWQDDGDDAWGFDDDGFGGDDTHKTAKDTAKTAVGDDADVDAWGAMDDFDDQDQEEGVDAWAAMDDFEDDSAAATTKSSTKPSPSLVSSSTKSPSLRPSATAKSKSPVSTTLLPTDDGEPDFAAWLVAQAQKKGTGKPLPKGLARKK